MDQSISVYAVVAIILVTWILGGLARDAGRKHGRALAWFVASRFGHPSKYRRGQALDKVRLADVSDGDQCWTTAAALYVDADGMLRLDENHLAFFGKQPEHAMRVIRDGWGFNTSVGYLYMRARG